MADPTAAPARTRHLLRRVEHYKAAQAARNEPPCDDESWLVLLTALASPDAAEE